MFLLKPMLKLLAMPGVALALFLLTSCNDDAPVACLEPPCGEIDDNATNLTVYSPSDGETISSFIIVVDDVETTISLSGIDKANGKYFSCWQTIPDIQQESVVVIGYELNGEPVIGAVNATLVFDNALVATIDGDGVLLTNYTACNNTN